MIFIFENANNIKKVISISKSIYKSIIFIYLPKVFFILLIVIYKISLPCPISSTIHISLCHYRTNCFSHIITTISFFSHNLIPFKIRYNRRLNLYVTYVMQPIKKLQFFSFFSLFFIKINFLPKFQNHTILFFPLL